MKLLILLVCKGTSAPVAPFQRSGGQCPIMHSRSGVPGSRCGLQQKNQQNMQHLKVTYCIHAIVIQGS